MRNFVALLTILSILFTGLPVYSQEFTIIEAGELDLESDAITTPAVVTEYFGMNVTGAGDSIIRVSVGDVSYEYPYEFQRGATQMYSYLLANNLVSGLNVHFRRGVTGSIEVAILDSSGALHDNVTAVLDIKRKASMCRRYPSMKVRGCKTVNLATASPSLRKLFARRFRESIKGPIILEPK